jgi:hypothetical protein
MTISQALALLALLTFSLSGTTALKAAESVEREALRYNDAVTKLIIIRDQTIATQRFKSLSALSKLAKNRARANDGPGTMAAWRAVLRLDRENAEARAFFTTAGMLDQVITELDAKPVDLLGLGADQ